MGELEHKLYVIYLIVTNCIMVQFTQFPISEVPVKPLFVDNGTCNTDFESLEGGWVSRRGIRILTLISEVYTNLSL
jgi:hypothetical protein